MGARIAAHVANAGLPVLLLDIVPAGGDRNAIAAKSLEGLKAAKPSAFADSASAALVRVGNFEDDLAMLKEYDWIIEAVAENLDIKRSLLAKAAKHLHPAAILTTNTSGLPVASIAELLPPVCANAGSAPTSSIPRAICASSSSSPRPKPIPARLPQ